METATETLLNSERVLTLLLVFVVLGSGGFFARSVWPKLSTWIEQGRANKLELERAKLATQERMEEHRLDVQREQSELWRQLSRDLSSLEAQIIALKDQQGVLIDAVGRLASSLATGAK